MYYKIQEYTENHDREKILYNSKLSHVFGSKRLKVSVYLFKWYFFPTVNFTSLTYIEMNTSARIYR